ILDYTMVQQIAFIPYGSLGAHPLRRGAPLAQADGVLASMAQAHQVNSTQIALAWLLHRAPNSLLIPGTTTIAHLEDNIKAASLSLSAAAIAQLDALSD
ncbi:MAG: aldo/keto reductase, partial [Cyanobacteria bacterium J06636_16]